MTSFFTLCGVELLPSHRKLPRMSIVAEFQSFNARTQFSSL